MPNFAEYRRRPTAKIPVVILEDLTDVAPGASQLAGEPDAEAARGSLADRGPGRRQAERRPRTSWRFCSMKSTST